MILYKFFESPYDQKFLVESPFFFPTPPLNIVNGERDLIYENGTGYKVRLLYLSDLHRKPFLYVLIESARSRSEEVVG